MLISVASVKSMINFLAKKLSHVLFGSLVQWNNAREAYDASGKNLALHIRYDMLCETKVSISGNSLPTQRLTHSDVIHHIRRWFHRRRNTVTLFIVPECSEKATIDFSQDLGNRLTGKMIGAQARSD